MNMQKRTLSSATIAALIAGLAGPALADKPVDPVLVTNDASKPVPVVQQGPVSVSVLGTPAVSIAGTPAVSIAGTPAVSITGTPTVSLAPGGTVSVANQPAVPQPFQIWTGVRVDPGDTEDCQPIAPPAGRLLTLQHVTFEIVSDVEPQVYLRIVQTDPTGTQYIRIRPTDLTDVGPYSGAYRQWAGNVDGPFYTTPGYTLFACASVPAHTSAIVVATGTTVPQ